MICAPKTTQSRTIKSTKSSKWRPVNVKCRPHWVPRSDLCTLNMSVAVQVWNWLQRIRFSAKTRIIYQPNALFQWRECTMLRYTEPQTAVDHFKVHDHPRTDPPQARSQTFLRRRSIQEGCLPPNWERAVPHPQKIFGLFIWNGSFLCNSAVF